MLEATSNSPYRDAIDKIEELVDKARDVQTIEPLCDDNAFAYIDRDGTLQLARMPTQPLRAIVDTFESFAAAFVRYENTDQSSIWVSDSQVVAILDESSVSRSDRITLRLEPHKAFAVLQSDQWKEQSDLIDTLRHDLVDAQISPEGFLANIRKLKFATKSESTGEYTNQSAAMGRSVEAAITGESDLPETVIVEFHPYPAMASDIDMNCSVTCTLFTDPSRGLLRLTAQPGEMRDAINGAKAAVVERLRYSLSDAVIFIGSP